MTEEVKQKRKQKRDYVYALGRQKSASARVRLYSHIKADQKWADQSVTKDQILVNSQPIEHYFSGPLAKKLYMYPFVITKTEGKFAVTIRVTGGGLTGQLGAAIQGIARALSLVDTTKYRPLLKSQGLLTRDARVRERRKVGNGGKARRKKQSPKR